jgi:hypothetical protein
VNSLNERIGCCEQTLVADAPRGTIVANANEKVSWLRRAQSSREAFDQAKFAELRYLHKGHYMVTFLPRGTPQNGALTILRTCE